MAKFKIIGGSITSPQGFLAASRFCNLKKIGTGKGSNKGEKRDLALIFSEVPAKAAGMFTTNQICAAPVKICIKHLKNNSAQAVVVNSGNANAHTGTHGIKIINEYVDFLSKKINCKKDQIFVSSTGVIGEIFDPKIIIRQFKKIENKFETKLLEAAKAIMTTDTYPKVSVINVSINKTSFKIYESNSL